MDGLEPKYTLNRLKTDSTEELKLITHFWVHAVYAEYAVLTAEIKRSVKIYGPQMLKIYGPPLEIYVLLRWIIKLSKDRLFYARKTVYFESIFFRKI